MALVAALAVLAETISWLRGGFGNLVYFFVFMFVFYAGVQLARTPWLDVTGISLIGSSMKAAAKAAFPAYSGSFVLTMASHRPLETFVWPGLDWTAGLILQRLLWPVVSVGVALSGSLFFNRFDPASRTLVKPIRKPQPSEDVPVQEETSTHAGNLRVAHLTPLAKEGRFHFNLLRLVWLECLLLVKGQPWYWLAGMAVFWLGCVASPSEGIRKYWSCSSLSGRCWSGRRWANGKPVTRPSS
jgi:hypothetical protein